MTTDLRTQRCNSVLIQPRKKRSLLRAGRNTLKAGPIMKGRRNAALLQHHRIVSGNVSRAMIHNQPTASQCYSNIHIQQSKKQAHRSQAPKCSCYTTQKRKRPAATAAKATAGEQRQTAALRRQKLKFGWAETLGTDTAGVINSEISAEQQQSTIGRTTMAGDQKHCPGATSSSMMRQKTPRTIMTARSAESQL